MFEEKTMALSYAAREIERVLRPGTPAPDFAFAQMA